MAHTFTITISDEDYKGLQYVAADPDVWFANMVRARCDSGKKDVQAVYLQAKSDAGEAIPAGGVDAHVNAAYDEGIVKTAAQANADAGPPGA